MSNILRISINRVNDLEKLDFKAKVKIEIQA